VQDHLERAFERIGGRPVRVHGAGRTDAGVHALAQCAHADVLKFLPAERWIKALNALLPPAIRVLRCRYVSHGFHARLSAKGKIYRYRIWTAPILPPFEYRRAWHIAQPLDINILKSAAKRFVGTHDFAGFAANRGKPEPSTIRTINSVRVRQKGPCITIEFDGDGFLYKMVRLMVGALVKCAFGKMHVEDITVRLKSSEPGSARFAAPAEGLFLLRVRY
jgi:tRNA pseudouridine38-40 synthase